MRLWKSLLFLLLALACCWKPILEWGAGLLVQTLLAQHEWHLVYEKLHWGNEGFVFTGVELEAPETFSLSADKVKLSWKKKLIEIDQPHLTILEWKFEDDFPDWKIVMHHGILEEKRMGRVGFSLQRLYPDQIARVIFEREQEQLVLEALREKEGIRLFAGWEGLQLEDLNPWLEGACLEKGTSRGSAETFFGKIAETKAHVEVEEATLRCGWGKVEQAHAIWDWEGPLAFSPEVRLRGALSKAYCQIGEGTFELTRGKVSSFPEVGLKLELASSFPWVFSLRVGFDTTAWTSGELAFAQAMVRFSGFDWECEGVGPEEVNFLKKILVSFGEERGEWALEQGKISGKGTGRVLEWIKGEKLQVSRGNWKGGVEKIEWSPANFSFSGGSFRNSFIEGAGWYGNERKWEGEIGGSRVEIGFIQSGEAQIVLPAGEARVCFGWEEGYLQGNLEGNFSHLEKISLNFSAKEEEIYCYQLQGQWAGVPFYMPHFALKGRDWAFDFRIEGPSYDVLRLWGVAQEGKIFFDSTKSHFLGESFEVKSCVVGKEGIEQLDVEGEIPLQFGKVVTDWLCSQEVCAIDWPSTLVGKATLAFHYTQEKKVSFSLIGEDSHPFSLCLEKEQDLWEARGRLGDQEIQGTFAWIGEELQIVKGVCRHPDWQVFVSGKLALLAKEAKFKEGKFEFCCAEKRISLEDCHIEKIHYDLAASTWRLEQIAFLFEKIQGSAHIECSSDFSSLSCVGDTLSPIRNFVLQIKEKKGTGHFQWAHQEQLLAVSFEAKREEGLSGYIVVKDPASSQLTCRWRWKKEFLVDRIEGGFQGLEVALYREVSGGLTGSIAIDFSKIEEFLPEKMRQWKLGKGYELKGRFSWEKETPSFQGILVGKEMELFGYQFRTLFAELEWSPNLLQIADFKLSDSAGILQIPQLTLTSAWIDIPHIRLQEFRPSLLQKIGEPLPPMSPFIIRELEISHLKGTLPSPSTYEAQGKVAFINSYRRTHTMFDLPADVLGLLVGLDQELLIPASGTLHFEIKEGRVHFTSLEETFSQGKRSQFFLVQGEDFPYLDLDGNLHILIKMKQFVLFKFTEFFLISIEGTLFDPEFRLQKRGLFGL